jgi:hypothetical protein
MKIKQLHEVKVPEGASFSMDKHSIMTIHTLDEHGHVLPDVAAFKFKVAGIIAQNIGLTSLEGLPKVIKGSLVVSKNKLTTMVGGPTEVHGVMDVNSNELTSIEGVPRKLTKLAASDNRIKSLHNIHKHIDEFIPPSKTAAGYNSGYYGTVAAGGLEFSDNPLTEAALGILKIKGFDTIVFVSESSGPMYAAMVLVNRAISDNVRKNADGHGDNLGWSCPVTNAQLLEMQELWMDLGLEDLAQL